MRYYWANKIPKKLQKELNKGIKLMQENRCSKCGTKMVNCIDSITKELSPYIWKCPKGCMKGVQLMKG